MIRSIEILVHLSGPSRGADDVRYRNEAHELLRYEPARRHEILPLPGSNSGDYGSSFEQKVVERADKTPFRRQFGCANDLPSSLLERFEKTTPYAAATTCVEDYVSTLPIPQSLGTSTVGATAPLRTTRVTPQLYVHRTPALPRQCITSEASTTSKDANHLRQAKSDSWRTPPSVVPDSQPAYSNAGRLQTSPSPCIKRALVSTTSSSPTQTSSLQRWKRQRVQENQHAKSVQGKGAELIESLLLSPFKGNAQKRQHLPSVMLQSLEIHPPRPHISTAQFITHLTPPLQKLSLMLPLTTFFNPSAQMRSLDKLERGHWYVPIGCWDKALNAKFWHFLHQFIGRGRAGWGVWCSKEYERTGTQNIEGHIERHNGDSEASEEVVKVYCWGEVVGEVWLVLWLASAQQIINVGARWIDARNETVLAMS